MDHPAARSTRVLRGKRLRSSEGHRDTKRARKAVPVGGVGSSHHTPKVREQHLVREERCLRGKVDSSLDVKKKGKLARTSRTVKPSAPLLQPKDQRHLLAEALGDHSEDEPGAPNMSRLEKRSITKAQRAQYMKYLSSFKDFCKECGMAWPPVELDQVLSDYFDDMFLEGASHATGQKILAAVEFGFIETKGQLVRARRALRGWQKLMPPHSRLPLPKPLAYGMAQMMMARGSRDMGIKLLMDFDLYLRPAEGMDILGKHVIPPVAGAGKQYKKYSIIIRDQDYGKPDKIGVFDNTLLLDNPATERWLGPAVHALAARRGKDRPIFAFSQDEFRKEFNKVGKALGVETLVTYQLRHGGASEDLNSKTRDFNQVRERGRWKTDTSVRRYAKTGKLQKMLQDLDKPILEYCRRSLTAIPRILQGIEPAKLA